MVSMVRWVIFYFIKIDYLMPNEALKLMQSKWDYGPIIPMYIINMLMDLLI